MNAIAACASWLEQESGGKALLVPSCTAALEAAVMLSDVRHGDEVILPSFAYPTCASSVIRAGGIPVFVDIELDTLQISERWLRHGITNSTKAVMPIWYAGVQGNWIKEICYDRDVLLIEDAAQCVGAFKLQGHFGAMSFHSSKNVSCGEGGALFVREKYWAAAQMLCSCGTDRYKNKKDWTWRGVGSSYLMSEVLGLPLLQSLRAVNTITENRIKVWNVYRDNIRASHKASVPGNGHIFWFMSEKQPYLLRDIPELVKHYEPLHGTVPGKWYGKVRGPMDNSIYASKHIVRPPMNVTEGEAFLLSERINDCLKRC